VTARAAAIAEVIRSALAAADRLDPHERDEIYRALVADLRSRRPENVSPMTLGPPIEPIRDPRVP
jgi:putative ubiquitin-RnfH superfamily antitoxin RatB of RatAB toxin-antitoxin module